MSNIYFSRIEYDTSFQDLQFLDDRIYEHNCKKIDVADGRLFSIFLRDDANQILGGLSGWTWAQACEIRIIWVHTSLRGQGYGKRLMEMAEAEARSRGCKASYLASYSFQAPEFYRKLGFEVFARLEEFPSGQQHYHLVKRLEVE